jgi:CubicO group peptidase (beta-lactamase class C family)
MALVKAEPLAAVPGSQVVYSDLGFMLLGSLVEKIRGESLADFARREIFKPLNMNRTTFLPSEEDDCAATEMVGGLVKSGAVHDENAGGLGGVAGHAGLFAPVRDLARYMAMWTGPDKSPLGRLTREQSLVERTAGLGGHRSWGWVLRGDGFDVAGDLWPSTTAGHTGFTGTSLVFDRPSGYWAILLTNRVHFGRQTDIGELRRRFHNAVAHALFR